MWGQSVVCSGMLTSLSRIQKTTNHFLLQDICGIICAILTWFLILYAEYVVMFVMLIPSHYPIYSYINMFIFNTLSFLAFSSHLRTMFSDPGAGEHI
jgi:hypothetical protein